MKIILLTHEKELLKKTGTGKIVKKELGNSCNIIPWKRKEPSILLEKQLSRKNTVLVYPGGESEDSIDLTNIENFIIIDGTWQESKKIFNKSPYLKKYRRFSFSENYQSNYQLRKNQKKSGLCTIESVIELYKLKDLRSEPENLLNAFLAFQKSYYQPILPRK